MNMNEYATPYISQYYVILKILRTSQNMITCEDFVKCDVQIREGD